jgi:alanine-synthesizing transaminase
LFSKRLDWRLEENELAALYRRRLAQGDRILDLTISNPTAVGLPSRGEALAAALSHPAVGSYEPSPLGPLEAREAVGREYARLGATVPPGRIVLTASSSESYALLFKLLADPGDTVLVPEPSYPLFDYLARLEGIIPRRYRLAFDGDWHIDWSSVEGAGARVIVLCNPNNPTGSFLRRGDLQRLTELCDRSRLAVIVDEVFADYPFAPAADAVATVAGEPLPMAAFALGGLSKSCGLPQMKVGWIAALGSEPMARAALHRLELVADTYLSVGTPVLRALPSLLAIGETIRDDIRARITTNRTALSAALPADGPVSWLPAEAAWSAILRVPAVRNDEEWALDLLANDGVLVQPGYLFDLTGLGSTLVLSLLTPPDDFRQGVEAITAQARA